MEACAKRELFLMQYCVLMSVCNPQNILKCQFISWIVIAKKKDLSFGQLTHYVTDLQLSYTHVVCMYSHLSVELLVRHSVQLGVPSTVLKSTAIVMTCDESI